VSVDIQPSSKKRTDIVHLASRRRRANPPFHWPKANPLRGRNYTERAIHFKEHFPVGTVFSAEEFDTWCHDMEIYRIPNTTRKQSDAWIGMLDRRRRTLQKLRNAACHPRMNIVSDGAYQIVKLKTGWYKVQTPHESLEDQDIAVKTAHRLATLLRKLEWTLQAQDWLQLPVEVRVLAEAYYDDIDGVQQRFALDTKLLRAKHRHITRLMQDYIQSSTQQPQLALGR
jgi:hypothetical protein